jgi:ATP/ADP translocase
MEPRALAAWGFRVPFLCGGLVAVAGYFLHKFVSPVTTIITGFLRFSCVISSTIRPPYMSTTAPA